MHAKEASQVSEPASSSSSKRLRTQVEATPTQEAQLRGSSVSSRLGVEALLGGSWVVISGVLRRITKL